MSWDLLVVQTCTFVAVSGMTYLAFRAIWAVDKRVQDRLIGLSGGPSSLMPVRSTRTGDRAPDPVRSRITRIVLRLLPNDERERTQLEARLFHAGIYAAWAPTAFLGVKLALIAIPPVIGLLVGQLGLANPNRAMFMAAIAGGMGIVLPNIWLRRQRKRRHAILSRSLPDFLDLMVACVQSGLSLDASMQRVTDELMIAHPVLAGEMTVVQRQIELGASPDLALRNFAERSDLPALFTLSTLIEQARRFGTSVSEALRTHAEMLRYQREQQAEEMAQKAAVKILFPTLLFIFPAIFVVLVGPAAVQIVERFSETTPAITKVK